MSQFSFEQKIEIVSKMALDYCNENGLKFKQYNQKFAELIVRECIKQVEVFQVRMDARPRHIVEAIKSHFGIEE